MPGAQRSAGGGSTRRPTDTAARAARSPVTGADGPDRSQLSDAELAGLLVAQDGPALGILYDRYGRVCYSLARRILGDEVLAQDVVQEVFLTLWRDASRYDAARGGFSTWLLAMTHHKAVDSVRKEEGLRRRRTTVEALEGHESEEPSVDEEVWTVLRREQVRSALAELPPAQREALLLAYFGGYTQREIAGLTDTPLGTVKTRMLAGMRKLRLSFETSGSVTDTSRTNPDTAGGPS